MAYNNDSLNNVIVKQLMKGVLPENNDINNAENKFQDENAKDLAIQILKQDKNIIEESSNNYNEYQDKSRKLDDILLSTGNAINIVFKSVKDYQAIPIAEGVDIKIQEFTRNTNQNEERMKEYQKFKEKKKKMMTFSKNLLGKKKFG